MDYTLIFVAIVVIFVCGLGLGTAVGEEYANSKQKECDVRKEFVKRLENKYGYVIVDGMRKAVLQEDIYECMEEYGLK